MPTLTLVPPSSPAVISPGGAFFPRLTFALAFPERGDVGKLALLPRRRPRSSRLSPLFGGSADAAFAPAEVAPPRLRSRTFVCLKLSVEGSGVIALDTPDVRRGRVMAAVVGVDTFFELSKGVLECTVALRIEASAPFATNESMGARGTLIVVADDVNGA